MKTINIIQNLLILIVYKSPTSLQNFDKVAKFHTESSNCALLEDFDRITWVCSDYTLEKATNSRGHKVRFKGKKKKHKVQSC